MDYVLNKPLPLYIAGKLDIKIKGEVYSFEDFDDSNNPNNIWDCQEEDYEVQLRMDTEPYNLIMVSVVRGDGEAMPYEIIDDSLTIHEDIYKYERTTNLFGK